MNVKRLYDSNTVSDVSRRAWKAVRAAGTMQDVNTSDVASLSGDVRKRCSVCEHDLEFHLYKVAAGPVCLSLLSCVFVFALLYV
jgi:hypothetical protein